MAGETERRDDQAGEALFVLCRRPTDTCHIDYCRMGIPDMFPDHYGNQGSQLDHYFLNDAGVSAAVKELLGV